MGWFGAKSNQSVGKSIKSTKSGKSAPTNARPKNAGDVKPKSPTRAKAREQQYQPPAGNNERKLRPPSQTQQTKHSEASRGAPNMIPAEKSSSSEEDELFSAGIIFGKKLIFFGRREVLDDTYGSRFP